MRTVGLLLSLALAPAAHAQNSQVKKAEAALEASDLEAAKAAVDKASVHKKTGEKGSIWVLKGRVYTSIALEGGIPGPDAINDAVSAWEGAVQRGAGKGAISEDVTRILAATTLVLRDDLESKRNDDAWSRVDAAMRGRTLLENVGWEDERIEIPLLQLAILTAVRADKLDEAKSWFTDWRQMDAFEPAVAVQVAGGIAASGDVDGAVAFLEPLLQDRPTDPAMLTKVVEIFLEADRADSAHARVTIASKTKDAGTAAGSLVLGHLFQMVGDDVASRSAYETALERNSEAQEAWLPLSQLLLASARALEENIASGALRRAQKSEARTQRDADLDTAAALLEKASDAAGGLPHKDVLKTMVDVYDALGRDEDKAKAQRALEEAE